eukprot:2568565-Rhodomonas_salina.1
MQYLGRPLLVRIEPSDPGRTMHDVSTGTEGWRCVPITIKTSSRREMCTHTPFISAHRIAQRCPDHGDPGARTPRTRACSALPAPASPPRTPPSAVARHRVSLMAWCAMLSRSSCEASQLRGMLAMTTPTRTAAKRAARATR